MRPSRSRARAAALGLVIATACGQDVRAGLDEPLVLHGAQFVAGELPGLPESPDPVPPRPTAATTEVTFLRPGLADVAFFGWTTDDAVSVAARVQGLGTGYWVVPTGPEDPAVPGSRTFRFEADLQPSLTPGRHTLLVAALDAAGRAGSQTSTSLCVNRLVPDNGNVCDPAKAPPELVISLAWDRPVDLDLTVVTPKGELVGAKTPSVGLARGGQIDRKDLAKNGPGVGFLDHDAEPHCAHEGRQLENVVFFQAPPPGIYLVYVNLREACDGADVVHYAVTRYGRQPAPDGSLALWTGEPTRGALSRVQAKADAALGTFVTELVVP